MPTKYSSAPNYAVSEFAPNWYSNIGLPSTYAHYEKLNASRLQ